jgi:Cys-tRNA(Pro) deacylase
MPQRYPVTPATSLLDQRGAEYTKHQYDYMKKGATVAAQLMGVDPHAVVKTLVMVDDQGNPMIVLMHAEKEVSLKELARQTGARNVSTAQVRDAERLTGYSVGGISPFATKRSMPVYVQRSILELPYLYINGGRRGFILGMKPAMLTDILGATPVDVAR